MSEGKKIFVFADWYEPGYKAGGPIRSCVNFARTMQEDYAVYVFTSDRDLGAAAPYEQIRRDAWSLTGGGVHTYYCSPENLTWGTIKKELAAVQPDYIYLNSMFSPKFTILPLLVSRFSKLKSRIVLSPRGMLRVSAIQFKSGKKKIFLNGFRWLGFHRTIHFLAADETEVQDVRRYFGPGTAVTLIPNFPAALSEKPVLQEKKAGELRMIFIGRIHPIKNLDFLLHALEGSPSDIRLTIVGSLEDTDFWRRCQEIIQQLPANIRVEYAGEKPNHQLPEIIAAHHIFALPTRGENFGHAIFEALSMGKPVLISDQTPWRSLTVSRAGWDLALDQPELFRAAIGQAAAFSQEEYAGWSDGSRKLVEKFITESNLKEEYIKLFS